MRIIDNKKNRLIDVLDSKINSNIRIYFVGGFSTSYALFSLHPIIKKCLSIQFLLNVDLDNGDNNLLSNNDEESLNLSLDRKINLDKPYPNEYI